VSRIILGWHFNQPIGDARIHGLMEELERRYQPLFLERLRSVGLWREGQGLLHVDVARGADDGLDLTEDRICCRTARPTAAEPESGTSGPLGAAALYDRLVSPTGLVRSEAVATVTPPFTFCWFDRRSARIGVVHDGLGLDQFFVSLTPAGVVFSNRCWPILRLTGEPPTLDAEAWRHWFCLGWFPDLSTPVRNVRVLGSGEIILGDSRAVTSTSAGALSRWIGQGAGGDSATLMPRAAEAVRNLIHRNRPAEGGFEADLTGGLDSRAICALLTHEGFRCRYYTGGSRWSAEVVLAKRIARRLGLEWTHADDRGPPDPGDPSGLVENRLRRFTLWCEGLVQSKRLCAFPDSPAPTSDVVYLGGGSSEISRGPYYRQTLWRDSAAPFDLDRSAAELSRAGRELLAAPDAAALADRMRHQLGEGTAHGLREWALIDHWYVHQKVRRWQAAHLAANLFDGDVLPFVNADHIALAFAMSPLAKAGSEFQRFIIQRNTPAILRVPVTSEAHRSPYVQVLRWLDGVRNRRSNIGWMGYVRGPGRASIEAVLSSGGPLWEILDRDRVTRRWHAFVQGTNPDLNFPLALLVFSSWHTALIEGS
jgi:hypothetical protein